jgi:hypothetical protein
VASWTRGRAVVNEVGQVVEDIPLLAGVCGEGAEEEWFEKIGKRGAGGRHADEIAAARRWWWMPMVVGRVPKRREMKV